MDFLKGIQTNVSTNVKKQIRERPRESLQLSLLYSSAFDQPQPQQQQNYERCVTEPYSWEYSLLSWGVWAPYADEVQNQIEEEWRSGAAGCK